MNSKLNEDLIDDLDDIEVSPKIFILALLAHDEQAKQLNQLAYINPQFSIKTVNLKEDISQIVNDFAIFLIECRIIEIFDDLQKIRFIRQMRPLMPILAICRNDDPGFQSAVYSAGATEVILSSIDSQILSLKIKSYHKLSESAQVLEIKNQESIQAMKSLREANEGLRREMNSRIEAESQKAIAEKQAEQHKQIREIMDHLEEGYFWVTKDRKISSQTSKACSIIFGKDISSYIIGSDNLLEFSDSDKEQHLAGCLDQLFDNILPPSVTLSMIPRNIKLKNGKTVTFDYTIISDKQNNPEKIIILAKDVTKEEEQRLKNEEQQKNSQILINILRNKESFINFISDSKKMLGDILDKGANDLTFTKRALHTLKGNSALFGLAELAHSIHDIESSINDSLSADMAKSLPEYCKHIESLLIKFLLTNKDILQISYTTQITKFSVDETIINSLYDIAEKCPKKLKQQIIEQLDLIKLRPISFFTSLFENTVNNMAKKSRKKIALKISGLDLKVNVKSLEPLFKNLIHAIRNACDHGIERPEERKSLGKNDQGLILLSFDQGENGEMKVKIKDDGRGIDPEKVKEKAIKQGIISENKAKKLSHKKILELIFEDGVSTAKKISSTSGRGVGMSALKATIEDLQGAISISSTLGKGTTFDIIIPNQYKPAKVASSSISAVKVMICEDEEALSQIYAQTLSRRGFQVKTFDNGLDALLELSKEKYDLILTDLRMPGLGGETVVKKIRELSNESEITPIIVISGFISDQVYKELMNYPKVTILEKPVTIKKFIPAIEASLQISTG